MLKLLMDTSNKEIGIGVFKGNKKLYAAYYRGERRYNMKILALVDRALKKTRKKPGDFDVFGATLGPGSFTGIRVGMSTAKGFAQALNKKFCGAPVLDVMAQSLIKTRGPVASKANFTGAASGLEGNNIYALLDAGRQEVYYAKCEMRNAKLKIKLSYKMDKAENVLMKIQKKKGIAVVLKNDNILVELLKKHSKIESVLLKHIDMDAFNDIIEANKGLVKKSGIDTVLPLYIRKSEAEVKLKKRRK